jgi:3-methylcrotonyl-CoA carboxylase alpha subunit
MIASLLVANRGEIACRIIRTAKRMGIRTVAVYSDVDCHSKHVRLADVAVRIGAASARESYLNIARIIEAALSERVDAVHPGYGFLSENAHLAEACIDVGLAFIGPRPQTIAIMGSKIAAKARMARAGVPVLPGYHGRGQDLAELERQALALGFPLMLKPAFGGGGKGMRILRRESELRAGLPAARRMAQNNFADGALLLERYLASPRHVEVQVFGDQHGRRIHLGTRDCSLQRRHQKVIEEARAPTLTEALSKRMCAAALTAAAELDYVSAGTVEFLVEDNDFYFMEMNTRLQVEHPVTEAITGVDLVEWQIRVAAGEPLPLSQGDIRFDGHAIEARVCAEDPDRGLLPSPGEIRLLTWPSGPGIRVDAGFEAGDTVPPSYDSLLGKIIAWAPSRAEAVDKLATALDATACEGIHTNQRWLASLLRSSAFSQEQHHVAWLDEQLAGS